MHTPYTCPIQPARPDDAQPNPLVYPPILTPSQAAAFCDRTPCAIYHWAGNSKLHGVSR